MRKLLVSIVAAGALSSAPVGANHQGCLVWGEVVGLDVIRWCTYTATTDTQTVHVATPNPWRVWVQRLDQNGEPVDVTLAQGHGVQAGPPPVVRPSVRETVHVEMHTDCAAGVCGTFGVLEVGMTDGH